MAVYTNGVLMGINSNVNLSISAIVNAHSYLGKSSYAGDIVVWPQSMSSDV